MLKKRIIPCLDIKNGRTVKGVQFEELRDAGDPVELAKLYALQGADELVFLDISASLERRKTLADLVEKVGRAINIPYTVGGGIASVEDAKRILDAGADKVAINSSALSNPNLITDLAKIFGSQAVVVSIDAKRGANGFEVYSHGATKGTTYQLDEWLKKAQALGAGEILLTSISSDGSKAGFDIDMLQAADRCISIPLIASGGAGKTEDFIEVFKNTNVSAALAASVFHYREIQIPELKKRLTQNQIPVR